MHLGWIETSKPARDPRRIMWVNLDGQLADLLPEHRPPIITGIASDQRRILVDNTGEGTISDIKPEVIGLSAQAFTNLVRIFK